jgi:hypothetical protein
MVRGPARAPALAERSQMRYMLVFLVACAVIGLWAPAHTRRGRLIFALTAALVIFFFVFPDKL